MVIRWMQVEMDKRLSERGESFGVLCLRKLFTLGRGGVARLSL